MLPMPLLCVARLSRARPDVSSRCTVTHLLFPMPQRQVAEAAPHDEGSSRALHTDAAIAVIRTRKTKGNGGPRASAAHELQTLSAAALQLQRLQLLQQALRRRGAEQRVRLQTKRAHGAATEDWAGGGGAQHKGHAASRTQL